MQRVLALDETYYHGGAHVFFGAYYGGRAPMFGGDFARAARHFDRAAALSQNQLKLVEVYMPGQPVKKIGMDGTLDGGDVLPGFSCPLSGVLER